MARPSPITTMDNRPNETVPKPNITWESRTYSLEEIIKSFRLPTVVQCKHTFNDDAPSRTNVDLLQPLLLYESRTCRKVTACNLKVDETTGMLAEIGDPLMIPEDYKGWFAMVGSETGLKTIPHYTVAGHLTTSDCDTFLIGGTDPVQAVQLLKKKDYPQTRDLYPGDVLRMGSVYEAKIKVKMSRFRSQTRNEKFLLCTDQTDREVLVSIQARGMFYILKHRSKHPRVPIMQIRDVIPRMNKSCVVKLVFGRIPNIPCTFTGMLSLKNVYPEATCVCSSIVNLRNIMMELPIDMPLSFRVAVPNKALLSYTGYLDAMALCAEKSDTFLRNLKVVQEPPKQSSQTPVGDEASRQHGSINAPSSETEYPRSEIDPNLQIPKDTETSECVTSNRQEIASTKSIPHQPVAQAVVSPSRPWELPRGHTDGTTPNQPVPKIPPKTAPKRNSPPTTAPKRNSPPTTAPKRNSPPTTAPKRNSPPTTGISQPTGTGPQTRNSSVYLTPCLPDQVPSSLPPGAVPTPLAKRFSNVPPVQPSFRLPPQPQASPLQLVQSDFSLPSPPQSPQSSITRLPPTPEEAHLRTSQKDLPLPAPPEAEKAGSPPTAPPPPPAQTSKPDRLERFVGTGQAPPPMRPPSQVMAPSESEVKQAQGAQFRLTPSILRKTPVLTPKRSIKVSVGNSYLMIPLEQETEQPSGDSTEMCLTDKMNFWKQMDLATKQVGVSASPKMGRTPKRKDYLNYSERGRRPSIDIDAKEKMANQDHVVYENFQFLEKVEYSGQTDSGNIYENHDALGSGDSTQASQPTGNNDVYELQDHPRGWSSTDNNKHGSQDIAQEGGQDDVIYEPSDMPVHPRRLSGADSGIQLLGDDENTEDCGLVGMSVTDVYEYLKEVNVKPQTRDIFKQNQVDGRALLALDETQLKAAFPSIGLVDRSKINMLISGFKIQQGK